MERRADRRTLPHRSEVVPAFGSDLQLMLVAKVLDSKRRTDHPLHRDLTFGGLEWFEGAARARRFAGALRAGVFGSRRGSDFGIKGHIRIFGAHSRRHSESQKKQRSKR